MIAKIRSGALFGIEAARVQVEAEKSNGLPIFHIVGMGDRAVTESRHRVRAAVQQSGFTFPQERVTVNLAPADLRKDGTGFDLPIAAAVLIATAQAKQERADGFLLAGELALDGKLRFIPGGLSLAAQAKELGWKGVILPIESAKEAAIVDGIEVLGCRSLSELVLWLKGEETLVSPEAPIFDPNAGPPELDLSDVRGQAEARFALEVAAAGGHNLLMIGPPGTGKTMLARRLPSILPDLSFDEALEATRVWSAAGRLKGRSILTRPPFCAPHHSVSDAGLVGASNPPAPGEVSLAHRGVLFLDELPEFRRHALESLREPLEDGEVRIRRAHLAVSYPASFQLIATMNPCPCGRFSASTAASCTCDIESVRRYRSRLSGPLLDRIDMHIEVGMVPSDALTGPPGEASASVRERVLEARERAQVRLRSFRFRHRALAKASCNAAIPTGLLREICKPTKEAQGHLAELVSGWELSARAFDRLLRVARTLADLDGREELGVEDVIRATCFRTLDQGL